MILSVTQGRVPKNDFGNIDLYVPTMLPAGAVHIPCEYHSRRLSLGRVLIQFWNHSQGYSEDRTTARV